VGVERKREIRISEGLSEAPLPFLYRKWEEMFPLFPPVRLVFIKKTTRDYK
jgi:hypothetical protein